MLIFFTNFGGGNGNNIGAFLFLIPIVFSIFGGLFGNIGHGTTYVYESDVGWRRIQPRPIRGGTVSGIGGSGFFFGLDALTIITTIVTTFFCTQFGIMAYHLGFRGAFRAHVYRRRFIWNPPQPRARQQQHPVMGRTSSERLAAVATIIQQLPITTHYIKDQLEAMSVGELKAVVKSEGLSGDYVEKREMVEAILAGSNINSTSAECIICQEEYEADDVLRLLPCGHKFHLECADRWFLSSTDFSRPPTCPFCNTDLPR